jgi:hypothetical protein
LISVKFDVEHGHVGKEHLEFSRKSMTWLDYLYKNAFDIVTEIEYCPNTYLDTVTYKFYLDPKHETFYRIKYNNN